MEEIFEAKKKRKIQKPCNKEQVMNFIKNCLAQPGFLHHLKKQQHKIDRQLKADEDQFQEEMRRLHREEENHLMQQYQLVEEMKTNGGKIMRPKKQQFRSVLPDEDQIEKQWKPHRPNHTGTPSNKL